MYVFTKLFDTRILFFFTVWCGAFLACDHLKAQTNLVPDETELAVLRDIYKDLGGASWTTRTNWPTASTWPTNATSAQFGTWFGVTVTNGDITALYYNSNNLAGIIPKTIKNLRQLERIHFGSNKISSAIPSTLNQLVGLTELIVNNNRFTGSIPDLSALRQLTILNIGGNPSLTPGPVPPWIATLSKLSSLNLSNSKRSGVIPREIGDLVDLTSLYLQQNRLSGELPETLGNCSKLIDLYVHNNALSGVIPASLSNCSNLTYLCIYNNQLSGTLPAFSGFAKLKYFYAHNNYLSGPIPSAYGEFPELIGFNVENNHLSGPIPPTIGNWTKLTTLALNNNQFTNDFPSEIGNCKLLTSLTAQYNMFTSIPSSVLSTPSLTVLNFSYNTLTSIPDFSTYSNKGNLSLSVQGNFLGFDTLEPQFTSNRTSVVKVFNYYPQNFFNDIDRIDVPSGSVLQLQAASNGRHGSILWEKKGSGAWINVNASNEDATQQTYYASHASNKLNGTYRWRITNAQIPALTLQSTDIDVRVVDAVSSSGTVRQYSGQVASIRWRTRSARGTGDADLSGMYLYTYDDKYQVTDARWAEPDHALNTFTLSDNQYRLTGMAYDPNGNIQSLKRYDEDGIRINDFAYSYEANRNRLISVTGYTHACTYNAIGQMIGEDKVHSEDQYVEYDVTGKVTAIYDDQTRTSKKVEYLYDDRGYRVAKITYRLPSEGSIQTTWYIRDIWGNITSIYEQDGAPVEKNINPLIQEEVPVYGSAKLGTLYPRQDESMAYEIADHLGNVRALLREEVTEYKATMEDNNQADISNPRVQEMNYFQNLFETEVNDVHMNHTSPDATVVSDPTKSAYLFWQNGMAGIEASDKAIGPSIALKVMPGDTIRAETYVRYENKLSYDRTAFTLSLFSAMLGNSFAFMKSFEGSTIEQVTQKFSMALLEGGFFNDTGDDTRPHAYLNYLVFDESMLQTASGWVRVTEDGGFDPGEESLADMHEKVTLENPLVIPQDGRYIFLWTSNESENTKVWFDDLTVTHVTSYVSEAIDYGVWGDVLRTSSKTHVKKSVKDNLIAQYLFNGNANDGSGHTLNGVVSGAVLTADKDGNANAAYSFDGVDDVISLPGTEDDVSFVQNRGVFTISAFIRLSDLTARSGILSTSQSTGRKGFGLMYDNISGYDHVIRFFSTIGTPGKLNEAVSTSYAIADNEWHHIAVVGDGQVIRLFIDGDQNNYSVGMTVFGNGDASDPLAIGALRNPTTAILGQVFMHGGIDEVHIFNKALTDAEIRLLATGYSSEEIDNILQPENMYRYAYQGQFSERDRETGWDHFELRAYDPVIGRWTSTDPERQFFSPYVAMANNPVTGIDPDGGSVISDWVGNNLPGLIAAPLAGAMDFVEGMGESLVGLFTLNGADIGNGLGDAGLGILRIIGLKEIFTERWVPGRTGGLLPESLANDINVASEMTPADASKNGMHAWHAGTNAALAHRLGPVGSIFVFLGGLFHESPLDRKSFNEEQGWQGTVNHVLDSFTDIIANTFGIATGLLLPKKWALNFSIKIGNHIPGPGETDGAFGGTGIPYQKGQPLRAWWTYPRWRTGP